VENRLGKQSIGFGGEVRGKTDRKIDELVAQVQAHDLLKFGIIPELVGRLPVISPLAALTRDEMIRILTEPRNALVKQYAKLFEYDQVELCFEQEALDAVADQAVARAIGARGLRSALEQVMTGIMYEIPSDVTAAKVTITGAAVLDKAEPSIERDETRTAQSLSKIGSKPKKAKAERRGA
jgi:ATP-dependent Clp protease ATP-binding subunit ClpX